jgi:hypothetical protein
MNTTQLTPRQEDLDMTDLIHDLVDAGLTRGLLAMTFTHGLTITPSETDVAALAALRLLTSLPQHVSVYEVIDGLMRRAAALATEVQ